jgi:hypothetical protein
MRKFDLLDVGGDFGMAKKHLDNDSLDKKSVIVLCKHQTSVQEMVSALQLKGYEVQVETSATSFFSHIETLNPAMALISRSADSAMKEFLPGYIKKKYKIPVITFPEVETTADTAAAEQKIAGTDTKQDIFHLKSHDQRKVSERVENIHKELKSSANNVGQPVSHKNQIEKTWGKFDSKVKTSAAFQSQEQLLLHTVRIESAEGDTQMVLALPAGPEFLAHRQKVSQWVAKELRENFGEKASVETVNMQVRTGYFRRMIENAGRRIEGTFDQTEVVLCMYEGIPDSEIPQWMDHAEAFVVPLEKWMTEVNLDFPIYLWLEINGKKVLYIRQGSPLTADQYGRLKAKGIGQVLVSPDAVDRYEKRRSILYLQPGFHERPWEDVA